MKKFPRNIGEKTFRTLLAHSGNQCAYPDCTHPIYNENNLLIAELCHIEAISPAGPRYNPNLTVTEVNSHSNLVFLCHRHHRETDCLDKVSLLKIKTDHENKFKESNFGVSNEVEKLTILEIERFWATIERVNTSEHQAPDFKVDIDVKSDELKLLNEVRLLVDKLNWIINELSKEKDPVLEHFELLCLAQPNFNIRLSILMDQLEIKILQNKLLLDPNNYALKVELENKKLAFLNSSGNVGLVD